MTENKINGQLRPILGQQVANDSQGFSLGFPDSQQIPAGRIPQLE